MKDDTELKSEYSTETLRTIIDAERKAKIYFYSKCYTALKIGYAELNNEQSDHATDIGAIAKMLVELE